MLTRLLRLTRNQFIRNVIILSSGTALAQGIAMLSSPLITRLYGPETYGIMSTFVSIVSMIAPITALTFPVAIVLPKLNTEAKGLVKLSLIVTTFMSVIIGVLILLFHDLIVHLFRIEVISQYLFLIPLIIFSAGLLQIIEQWLIRTNQFIVSAKSIVLESIIIYGSKVGFGLFYPFASVLIFISAFTHSLKVTLMFILLKKFKVKDLFSLVNEKISIKGLFKKYRDFPLYRSPEVFFNSISENLPIILLTFFFGPASAGFYSICRTVLNVPSNLIGKSVGNVFYPRIAEAANSNEDLTKLIKKATIALSFVGLFPYGIIIIFGPLLFSFVFGTDWVTAGEYARWIALGSFFGFINKPSVKALPVLSAQAFQLKYTILTLLIRTLVLYIGFYMFKSDIVAVALFGIMGAMLNVGLILKTVKLCNKFHANR